MSPAKKTAAKKKTTKKSAARKKTAAKKKTAKKKVTKKAAKKPAAKKATKKAAAKKATAKKAPAKKAAAKKKATKKKRLTKKQAEALAKAEREAARAAAKPVKPGKLVVAGGKRLNKLGIRWTCWSCNAVFYDLNKPDPICPKCDTDQTAAPKESKSDDKPAPKRDSLRALRVLDDDDATREVSSNDSESMELDLELGTNEKLLEKADSGDSDED